MSHPSSSRVVAIAVVAGHAWALVWIIGDRNQHLAPTGDRTVSVWVQLQPRIITALEGKSKRDDYRHAELAVPPLPTLRFSVDTPVDIQTDMERAAQAAVAATARADEQRRAFDQVSSPLSTSPRTFSIFPRPMYEVGHTVRDDSQDMKTYVGKVGNRDCFVVANLPNEGAGWHDAIRCVKKNREPRGDLFQNMRELPRRFE